MEALFDDTINDEQNDVEEEFKKQPQKTIPQSPADTPRQLPSSVKPNNSLTNSSCELPKVKLEPEPEKFDKWKESENRNHSFPEKESKNRERRDDKIVEQIDESEDVEYKISPRSIRKSKRPENYKILLEQYINEEDVFICQMCEQSIPRKNEEEFYFEAVQIPKTLSKEVSAHLALCPTCSAKYKYLFRNDEMKIIQFINFIKNYGNDDNLLFTLDLGKWNNSCTVRFTKRHLGDLKVIFNQLD